MILITDCKAQWCQAHVKAAAADHQQQQTGSSDSKSEKRVVNRMMTKCIDPHHFRLEGRCPGLLCWIVQKFELLILGQAAAMNNLSLGLSLPDVTSLCKSQPLHISSSSRPPCASQLNHNSSAEASNPAASFYHNRREITLGVILVSAGAAAPCSGERAGAADISVTY